MSEEKNLRRKIAVLIDGDNAQGSLLPKILVEVGKYGQVTVRRIYGDWTTSNMNSWKDNLNFHAVQPIQQFRYTIGKNATDSAMIIDAMDLLHSGVVDGFALVSSDSDYTRLATRIRESGIFVMGIGEKKTPRPFVNACDIFIFTENLVPKNKPKKVSPQKSITGVKKSEPEQPDLMSLLQQAFEVSVQEDGWATLAAMGNALYQIDPSFDPRTYGHRQLSHLIASNKGAFEQRGVETNGTTLFYVKLKD
ncbi:MAG: NYN domain-containing protein [Anaerolineales bacterium]|nr:NYN domain-containing protein [Anaerolineales bacterium]